MRSAGFPKRLRRSSPPLQRDSHQCWRQLPPGLDPASWLPTITRTCANTLCICSATSMTLRRWLMAKPRSNLPCGTHPILLSARAGEESRIEGIETGADDYLVKPFSARELTARVETHLKLSRVRREAQAPFAEKE